MSALLERLADRTVHHAMDLASAVEEDIRSLTKAPDPRRLQVEVSAARALNELLSSLANLLTAWREDTEELLRKGVAGPDFSTIVGVGENLSRLGLASIVRFGRLWHELASFGASEDEVQAARESLSRSETRILEVKSWTDHLAQLARRKPPEIDPALIESGAEAIRQGRFKTTTQILESLRSPAS